MKGLFQCPPWAMPWVPSWAESPWRWDWDIITLRSSVYRWHWLEPSVSWCFIVDMNDTCHFALFPMTEFDENQENGPFLKFFPKTLCAYTKRHYLCTRKD